MAKKNGSQKSSSKGASPHIRDSVVAKIAHSSSLPENKVRSALKAVAKSMH